jgi:hypothetical protein
MEISMRTDLHRPSAIKPEEYQFVAFEHLKIEGFGDCAAVLANRELIRQHMSCTGGTYSHHEHGGNCMVCGAWAIYTVLFYHTTTNSYVRTGQDCANKMDMSYGDMNLFRKQVNDYRQRKAGINKAEGILNEAGLGRAWDIRDEFMEAHRAEQVWFESNGDNPDYGRGRQFAQRWGSAMTICDIVSRLIKYGSISDKALNFVRILVDRHDGFAKRMEQREAEREAAAPCPAGRVVVEGTVLKVEARETSFGMVTKMTVKATEGFIVWMSVPSSMAVTRGETIKVKVTLEPSATDPKFGFGKRPIAA